MSYEKIATCICGLALGQATTFCLKHDIRESKYWAVIGEFLAFFASRSLLHLASSSTARPTPEKTEEVRRAIKKEIFTGRLCGQIDIDTQLKIGGIWSKSSLDLDALSIAYWSCDLDGLCITRERIQSFLNLGFNRPLSDDPLVIGEYAFLIRASVYAHGEHPLLGHVAWVFNFMKISVKDFDRALASSL